MSTVNLFRKLDENESADIKSNSIINLGFFTGGKATIGVDANTLDGAATPKKKGRPKKKTINVDENASTTEIPDTPLPMHQSNEPYKNSYDDTTNLLRGAIAQVDEVQGIVNEEVNVIRASKTMKKKYDYLTALLSTSSSNISTKIGAIKEMNKTITDSHNLELKRIKDLKLNVSATEVDDDKYIMDMYNAFINTPVGTYGASPNLPPNISDITMMTGSDIGRVGVGQNNFDNFMTNLSPAQNMMLLESNKNVETVVVYDAASGNRFFDVMDVTSGQSIPNADKPDNMFLEDMHFDYNNNIARNKNLDTTYRLIVINNSNLMEY